MNRRDFGDIEVLDDVVADQRMMANSALQTGSRAGRDPTHLPQIPQDAIDIVAPPVREDGHSA